MTAIGELWPDRNEYDLAVARWTETIFDPELRSGKLDYDHLGIRRYGGANLYICVYRISNWMIRCFCSNGNRRPPADIRERYQAIARFSQEYSGRVSALTPITYDEQGIRVGSRVLPLVKMPFFANCPSLGEFVTDHYTETSVMQQLCDAWLRMIGEMEAMQIAHGDLDLSNVLIEQRGPAITLRLIDYDNMWVPSLAGHSQTEYGHQHFQHPAFMPPKARPYTAGMDRFSALVIFISLRALVAQPQLYDQWGADESERLLFAESDYQNTGLAGNRIARLRELGVPDLYPYIDELLASLRDERMPRSLPAITSALYRPPMPPPGAPRPPRAVWSQAQYNTPATPSISLAPLPRGDLRSGDLQSMGAAKMFSPQPAPPAVVPAIKENNAPRSPDVMQVAAVGPTGKHHLWLWVVIGVVIGLLIVAALALALLFMPGLRSGSASQPALLPAAILDESTLSAQTTAFQAALNVSPNSTGPNTCIPQGSAWSCSVTLSASHIPPFSDIIWRANASFSRILVNPSSGTVFLNKPVQVTISGLPCSAEQVTFSGTENGQPVNSATMFWNCTPTPTPAPSPTPTPMLSPTPTPEPTPTSTPKPSPTPLLSATPSPTPTPASTSTPGSIGSNGSTGPGGSPPSNTGGLPDSLPVGGLLAAASLLLALLAFLLYLLPRPGEQSTLLGKLRSLIIPDGLLHR